MEDIGFVAKIVGITLAVGGFITAAIWRINALVSSKDGDINKGYNRALEVKINSNKELAESEMKNQKEDIKSTMDKLSEFEKNQALVSANMAVITTKMDSILTMMKADREAHKEEKEALKEENGLLKKSVEINSERLEIEKQKLKASQADFREKLKEVTATLTELVNDPVIKKDLKKIEKDLLVKMKRVETEVGVIKEEWEEYRGYKDATCKERKLVELVKENLNPKEETKK